MEFNDILFIGVFGFPIVVFLYFKSYLEDKKKRSVLFLVSGIFVVVAGGYIYVEQNWLYIYLVGPLLFFLNYSFLRFIFLKVLKRESIDTIYNWESGLFYNRIFNFLVITIGLLMPLFLIVWLAD